MTEGVIQRAFAAGELAPVLHARADQAKYQTGLRACKNFLVLKEGGVANRPGFRYVGAVKDSTVDSTFLFPFKGAIASESVLIEAGEGYLRFFKQGAPVTLTGVSAYDNAHAYAPGDIASSGGVNYWAKVATTGHAPPHADWYAMPGAVLELPHPFLTHRFNVSQNGVVLTLTHQDIPPQELLYGGLTHWALLPLVTKPATPTPTGLTLVSQGTVGPGPRVATYAITAAMVETYEESLASATVVTLGTLEDISPAKPNVLSWDAVPNVAEYYVYADLAQNGIFGFLGTALTPTFKDEGFVPDMAITPPQAREPFVGAGHYPHISCSFQQRRFFASTAAEPDSIWASRTGFPRNFAISSPLQDDDALTFRIDASGPVRWLVALKQLIVLAEAGEWTVGEPKQALEPASIPTDQETYVGAADKAPVVVGNSILYLQARGSVFRELICDKQVEGWAGRDLTVFASHLFKGFAFFAFAYQQVPDSIVWAIRNDGALLGLTYIPEQDIWGWHRHDTDGLFEDVCVVPEPGEDGVYVIVKRTLGGATVRCIERQASRVIREWDRDSFFVDSGLSYHGTAVKTVSGLSHLAGQTVEVVADGVALPGPFTVSGSGSVTLPTAAEHIHVGLPIPDVEIETLDLDVQGSSVRAKRKRLASLTLLIEGSSRTFAAGPDRASLRTFVPQAWEPTDLSASGPFDLNLTSHFTDEGRLVIRQLVPLPLTILGVIPQVELGG